VLNENCVVGEHFVRKNLKERNHFVEIGASDRVTLNCNLAKKKKKKKKKACRLNSSGSGYNPMLRFCVHRDEFRGNREFLYKQSTKFSVKRMCHEDSG